MTSQIELALRKQRSAWLEIVTRFTQENWSQSLPPTTPYRIILLGVGSSLFSAHLAACALRRGLWQKGDHRQIDVISCSSVDIGVEVTPQRGDWVIAFSHRGQTPVTLKALERSDHAGAFTIWVAAQGTSQPPSARLMISTCELEQCEPHTFGMTSAICAVTCLLLGFPTAELWKKLGACSDPDLEDLKKKVGMEPQFILGEWEGEWIAREIALKFTEMAHLKVSVYSTEEFFHGPRARWLANKKEPIWTIALPGDARQKEVESSFRVNVGPLNQDPACALNWVNSLVEFQWAVLAVALNLSKNPDLGV